MSGFTPPTGVPQGERFDLVYVQRGNAVGDSERMRHRFAHHLTNIGKTFPQYAEGEMGLPTPYSTGLTWRQVLSEWNVVDVLTLLTVAYRRLGKLEGHFARDWVDETNRIFKEENISYRMDPKGGVHHQVDDEFTHNSASTIAALADPRYANVRHEFEGGLTLLSKDNKLAIRRVFGAAENLFKLMLPGEPRLGAKEAEKLTPQLRHFFKEEDQATNFAAPKIIASFKDWIDACHFYRHEQAEEKVAQPPTPVAVHLISSGASFIRLMAEIDIFG